jgi:hypothetical protein
MDMTKNNRIVNKLSSMKAKEYRKLDKQIIKLFDDKYDETIKTELLYDDIFDTLYNINEINKKTNLHLVYKDFEKEGI